jgi:C-terminal processing protease CtpA/Prc
MLKMGITDIKDLGPHAEPFGPSTYRGKIVLLVNRRTGSAAESMVMGLKDASRATVIGETTAGGTGNGYELELPGGAKARINVNKIVRLDGSRFHNVGIKPDIPVKRTVTAIRNGKDEILDAAIAYMKESQREDCAEK